MFDVVIVFGVDVFLGAGLDVIVGFDVDVAIVCDVCGSFFSSLIFILFPPGSGALETARVVDVKAHVTVCAVSVQL